MKLVVTGLVAVVLAIPVAVPAAEPFVFTDTIAVGKTLDLRDINGSISVVTGERLEVRATKIAGHRGNPDDVKIITRRTAAGISVCVQYPNDSGDCSEHSRHSGNDNDTEVDFSVRVPHGVNVDATSVNGAVDVHTDALASGRSVNGNVRVEASDVTSASTVNGSVNVRVHDARSTTALRLATVNGSVTCTIPAAAGVHVHASVLNGSIAAGDLAVKRPQYGPGASVDGSLGDGRRDLRLEAVNGNLTVMRS
jgi:cytoskeletal protein CcmA (bactofilin family)